MRSQELEAVILVGGLGTRLRRVVCDRPKPMAEVAGKPFVEYLITRLKTQGIRRVVFSTGYLGDQVAAYFGTGDRWGIDIAYSQESEPLGTGGAIRLALGQLWGDRLLVLNGDSYCRFDVSSLLTFHQRQGAHATLLLAPVSDCSRYGSVVPDSQGWVQAFREKQPDQGAGLVNAGVYLLERQTIEQISAGRAISLETEVFPQLVGKGLCALVGTETLLDIGTPESYAQAERFLAEMERSQEEKETRSPATVEPSGSLQFNAQISNLKTQNSKQFPPRFALLDRDGTLIVERNYLSHPDQVELLPGAIEGLRQLRQMGLGLVVVTNQSGIGRGYFDHQRLEEIHLRFQQLLQAEGVYLDRIYYCPHTPDDRCACRKPQTGLIQRAAAEFGFHPSDSFVIGDKPCDIELGKRVGAMTLLVRTGYGAEVAATDTVKPDSVVENLAEAAQVIQRSGGVRIENET
jgi:histidinol-phosphate phosphatase family protein